MFCSPYAPAYPPMFGYAGGAPRRRFVRRRVVRKPRKRAINTLLTSMHRRNFCTSKRYRSLRQAATKAADKCSAYSKIWIYPGSINNGMENIPSLVFLPKIRSGWAMVLYSVEGGYQAKHIKAKDAAAFAKKKFDAHTLEAVWFGRASTFQKYNAGINAVTANGIARLWPPEVAAL